MMNLARESGPAWAPISRRREMGAYEALWLRQGATFKSIANKFDKSGGALPSDLVPPSEAEAAYQEAMLLLADAGVTRFGIRVHGAGDYPPGLRDAKEPVELLYYQGAWEFADTSCVAVVGTRKPSREGRARARRLARLLVEHDITVVSGLATGIDTEAHTAAIEAGGRTIAVIGTPLGVTYPEENRDLQRLIANRHLLISQVPIVRYSRQAIPQNRLFFPERNKTMSALTSATVIVEAGETSGTLTQARAALHQGRKLLIMDNLFRNKNLTWPRRYQDMGAIRIDNFDNVIENVPKVHQD